MEPYVIKFEELGMNDVETVGGKNASLGEMISNLGNLGITVPGGFATTAAAYREFLNADGLDDRIHALLDELDVDDIDALTEAGSRIRQSYGTRPGLRLLMCLTMLVVQLFVNVS